MWTCTSISCQPFPISWGSECKNRATPQCGKCSPNQSSQLRKYWPVSQTHVHSRTFCQPTAQVMCNSPAFLVSTPQNYIIVTQGHYVQIAVNISWDTACLCGKLWRDRKWCLLFPLSKLGNEHLPLLEIKKIFLWSKATLLPLLWFSTSSFLENGIINFKIIPAHRCVIYSPS